MTIEKRNVITTDNTPGIKQASDMDHDPVKAAASGFDKKKVADHGRKGKTAGAEQSRQG